MKPRWFIPILMLIAAALACSPPQYDPPIVKGVLADTETPGQAYILVGTQATPPVVYATQDYGQSWQRASFGFPTEVENSYDFEFDNGTLYHAGQPVWSYPVRRTFRSFFLTT
jgi:hypothetical protein